VDPSAARRTALCGRGSHGGRCASACAEQIRSWDCAQETAAVNLRECGADMWTIDQFPRVIG
jgi:hypothetical protein